MLVSIVAYTTIWGLSFAVGFVQGVGRSRTELVGIPQLVVAKDGWDLPQPHFEDTVLVAPGERIAVRRKHASAALDVRKEAFDAELEMLKPDAWHPLDLLAAPLYDDSGELRGLLTVDAPVDGLRPGPHQRAAVARMVAEPAVGLRHELRADEEADALHALGCAGHARQHEVHDVGGHVVLAIGDEDLRPLDAIGTVGLPLGAGAQRADVGAGLRLGELHGAHPFARHELRQISALELPAPVRRQRIDRADLSAGGKQC